MNKKITEGKNIRTCDTFRVLKFGVVARLKSGLEHELEQERAPAGAGAAHVNATWNLNIQTPRNMIPFPPITLIQS